MNKEPTLEQRTELRAIQLAMEAITRPWTEELEDFDPFAYAEVTRGFLIEMDLRLERLG